MTPPNNNGYRIVIAGPLVIAGPIGHCGSACHCGPNWSLRVPLSLRAQLVIAGLTRNPVHAYNWIPDVETPDLIRGRDDNCGARDNSY